MIMSSIEELFDEIGGRIMLDDVSMLKSLLEGKELSNTDIDLFSKLAKQFDSKQVIAYLQGLRQK